MKLHHRHFLAAFAARAAAQETNNLPKTPNPSIGLLNCEDLACNPSGDSVCNPDGLPGAPISVGMAPQVLNLPSANLSLTLIDGLEERGFTVAGLPAYEYTDLQLFVGVDPNLADDDYPSGCALMMQYQGQTFPISDDDDDNNNNSYHSRSTACGEVVDELCQADIYNMVRSFDRNASASSPQNNTSSDHHCNALTRHINTRLREDAFTCGGGRYLSAFINVTGGALPGPESQTADHNALGGGGGERESESCRPMLPQGFGMYAVARMRQYYFVDTPASDFLRPLFGGRAGSTPVFTVVYDGANDTEPEVQFVCMKTFLADGEPQPGPFEGAAAVTVPGRTAVVVAALVVGVAMIM